MKLKNAKSYLLGVLFYQFITFIPDLSAAHVPLPVKKRFTITSAEPLNQLWGSLSDREKNLATHLQKAARAGRDLLFIQSHRHALLIKQTFEEALSAENFEKTRRLFGCYDEKKHNESFQEFLLYTAQFEDQGGPYGTSNRKYILNKTMKPQLNIIFRIYAHAISETTLKEIIALLTDPTYEVLHRPENPNGSDLIESGGNIYQKGITGSELQVALDKGLRIELNCQVLKNPETGEIYCQKMTSSTPGPIGDALFIVIGELERAHDYASTRSQAAQIEFLIHYFQTGEMDDFRNASIEWVRDGAGSKVDFMMGFIEVYDDFKGNVGSWESYVQIVDPETTRVSQLLATNAQYFEDQMPYGQWKKQFPEWYSSPAIMVYYFQEIANMRSGGYNLPNFDDIRRDFGSKNVIRLPLPGEAENPEKKAMLKEFYMEFGPSDRVNYLIDHFQKQRLVLVLLHEIIGHGSGTYDPTKYDDKEDPISALGASGSALEEQRADLAALVFAADTKLVELGIYKSTEEALAYRNAMYDIYLIDFMRLISKERSFSESHMRGHWLLIKSLLDQGAIGWANRDPLPKPGKQILVVKNYNAFWKGCNDLLGHLQTIKATRQTEELERLFREGAPLDAINEPWAQAVIARGENLKVNAGSYEQSWFIDDKNAFKVLGPATLDGISKGWIRINYPH